ncbi:MAG: hypothetical protein UZ07_CHB004000181 [Chlorobi bacterium OLB7]|nr:MAG: hypothetical protein UZ07_CHB004000181 [Chlorobi bacterium OLB7]
MIRNHASIARISGCRWLLIPMLAALLAPIGCASSKKQPQVIYYRGAPSNVKEFTVDGFGLSFAKRTRGPKWSAQNFLLMAGLRQSRKGSRQRCSSLRFSFPRLAAPEG